MSTIRIEITKEVTNSMIGGHVAIYVGFPHAVGINETRRLSVALDDAIRLAVRWQDGNQFAVVIDEKPVTPKPKDETKAAGGNARAGSLTPERRKEIASAAGKARWAKRKEAPKEYAENQSY